MPENREDRLLQSWVRNAESWTEAVRDGRIESRRRVTDQAVVEAVRSCGGSTVLDIGCGEGWLARRLSREGLEVLGFDGSARLVERARERGGGSFILLPYEAFAREPGRVGGRYDVAVSNFSLFSERIDDLLSAVRRAVAPRGRLVIQTVHPLAEGMPDQDGWREETFAPLAPLEFTAMPWYFRTQESWTRELERSGWRPIEAREPVDPTTGEAASLILVAEANPQYS